MINKDMVLKIFEAARPDLTQSWCPHPGTVPATAGCLMNWLSYHTTIALGLNFFKLGLLSADEYEAHARNVNVVYDALLSANGLPGDTYLGRWNDRHTHAEVLAAVDATIAALKKEPAVLPDSLRNLVRIPEKV